MPQKQLPTKVDGHRSKLLLVSITYRSLQSRPFVPPQKHIEEEVNRILHDGDPDRPRNILKEKVCLHG